MPVKTSHPSQAGASMPRATGRTTAFGRAPIAFASGESRTSKASPAEGRAGIAAMLERLRRTDGLASGRGAEAMLLEALHPEQALRRMTTPAGLAALAPRSAWKGLGELAEPDIGLEVFDPAVRLDAPAPGAANRAEGGASDELRVVSPCLTNQIDLARRVLDRTTFGPSDEQEAYLAQHGIENYIKWQLNPLGIDDSDLEQRLGVFPTLTQSQSMLLRNASSGNWTHANEFIAASIMRATLSKRQLFERCVEFWSDHFNIYYYKDGGETFKPIDDRDAIRPNVLGRFGDLLLASASSPAMLLYLDNAWSFADDPNQNYARELMELHTLGVDNYTQEDIVEVARCFTGWSVEYDDESPNYGGFLFRDYWHDNGMKRVLGRTIPANGGVQDGYRVLEILSEDPRIRAITARFLARKLATRFWGYNPPQALVDRVRQAYLSTNGDLRAMTKAALDPEFLACSRPKLKRPYHLAISALRTASPTFPGDPEYFWYLRYILDVMGQHPHYWAPPNGYPDSANYWAGHILPRWRFGFYLLNEQSDIRCKIEWLWQGQGTTTVLNQIVQRVFHGAISPTDRERLRTFLAVDPDNSMRRLDTLGLAIASASFQWY